MTFRKSFGEFLSENKTINEDHLEGRQQWYDYIYKNAHAAGYPDLSNMELLISLEDIALENMYKMVEFILQNNDVRESAEIFLSEKSDHEGWFVIGFDKDSKKAEILSIPLIKKEAIRFLQSFEVQMGKLSDNMKKYTKLKLAHASDVFETISFDGIEYEIIEK